MNSSKKKTGDMSIRMSLKCDQDCIRYHLLRIEKGPDWGLVKGAGGDINEIKDVGLNLSFSIPPSFAHYLIEVKLLLFALSIYLKSHVTLKLQWSNLIGWKMKSMLHSVQLGSYSKWTYFKTFCNVRLFFSSPRHFFFFFFLPVSWVINIKMFLRKCHH